jgi:integrase
MPYRRKNSPYWWVSIELPSGQRVRRSTETASKKEAAALELKWKLEIYRQEHWDDQPKRSFDELMLIYLQATERKCSHRRDLDAARHLTPYFAGTDLNGIGAREIRGYTENRRGAVKPATINRELCLLSVAINYARRELEWDIPNPVSGRKLKEPEGRVRWISNTEAQALIVAAETEANAHHLADFIQLALNTGCRKQEILGLEWSRVDLGTNLIFLEAVHTKTSKRRSVPLNQGARSVLLNRANFRAEHCPASPWVFAHKDGSRIKDVKRSFKTACDRAGIGDFRIHDLRHTCAAWLVSDNVPLTAVRDLLGHTTVKMTERYAHLAPENVRTAVAVLDRQKLGHNQVTLALVSK